MSDVRLYGLPGSEHMAFTAEDVYESDVEPWIDESPDRTAVKIEEWSVVPNLSLVPPSDLILERLAEEIGEEMTEQGYDHIADLVKNPGVVAAAEMLREAIASRITYRMADQLVAEHVITWDENDEPLLDGEPMYGRSVDV